MIDIETMRRELAIAKEKLEALSHLEQALCQTGTKNGNMDVILPDGKGGVRVYKLHECYVIPPWAKKAYEKAMEGRP
jgi:hypothetical protein